MSQRISVIDLGTNTFHLLTVEVVGPGQWITVDRERVFVNLASDGIDLISASAMQRGLDTMAHFHHRIRVHGSHEMVAVGTAALRRATNAGDFISRVYAHTGIAVEVISGEREAYLITKGVLRALPEITRPLLIMDIGGGSVELILHEGGQVRFAESYQIGVAVLHADFHTEEPIHPTSLARLDDFLNDTLEDLLTVLRTYPDAILVGASGTFEVVESILDPHSEPDVPPFAIARPDGFESIYREFVGLTLDERLAHPGIPVSRAKYIVVAVHLIEFMLRMVSRDLFYISNYAMKEGLVEELSDFLDKSK